MMASMSACIGDAGSSPRLDSGVVAAAEEPPPLEAPAGAKKPEKEEAENGEETSEPQTLKPATPPPAMPSPAVEPPARREPVPAAVPSTAPPRRQGAPLPRPEPARPDLEPSPATPSGTPRGRPAEAEKKPGLDQTYGTVDGREIYRAPQRKTEKQVLPGVKAGGGLAPAPAPSKKPAPATPPTSRPAVPPPVAPAPVPPPSTIPPGTRPPALPPMAPSAPATPSLVGVSAVECAALTYTGTETTLRFDVDPQTGTPLSGGFTFVLLSGTVNRLNFAGSDVEELSVGPGLLGEMKVRAAIRTIDGFNDVVMEYDGNNYASLLPNGEIGKPGALNRLFSQLVQNGGFGQVPRDPNMDPQLLGGAIDGFVIWQLFNEDIRFRNIICMSL